MKHFHDSNACRSRAHCRTACRVDSPQGEAWRDSVAAHWKWDKARTCPIGLIIGEPVPLTISPAPAREPQPRHFRDRLRPGEVAAGIIKVFTLGLVKMCPTCQGRRKRWNAMGWRGVFRAALAKIGSERKQEA